MMKSWKTSLWDYKIGELRQLINTVSEKSLLIKDVFADCRELPCIPRRVAQMAVQDVSASPGLIMELWKAREGMKPEAIFKLGCKPSIREKQLINSLGEIYRIDTERARAKVVLGRYSDSQQTFTYAIEVVIAPRTDLDSNHAGKVWIVDCINDLASSSGGGTYFDSGEYNWRAVKGRLKGIPFSANSIKEIMFKCGFNNDPHLSKVKKPCVLFINLKCRVIEWLGAKGKTQINTTPFASDLASVVSSLAYKMPSYHGHGFRWADDSTVDEAGADGDSSSGEYVGYLRNFLIERRMAVEADPSLTSKDRLTQSGVWYRIRPEMIRCGFKPRNKSTDNKGRTIYDWGSTRTGLTRRIRITIEELWPGEGITREYLGIVAKARAMLYFNGQVFPVTFDSREELARTKTTDLIIVEKEGITDVLLGAANRYRIALVATAGQFTDYVQDLMQLAVKAGLNVWILTDYDIHGINIWRNAKIKIKRLGITRDTIKWFQENGYPDLREEDVEEEYSPNPKLLREDDDDDPYLLSKRIELDSVIEKVGGDAFWNYLVHLLSVEFHGKRDYRGIVPEPQAESYYNDEIIEFLDYIEDYTKGEYYNEWVRIENEELTNVDGLLDVESKTADNDQKLKPIVQSREGMKLIAMKLKELKESGDLPEPKSSN